MTKFKYGDKVVIDYGGGRRPPVTVLQQINIGTVYTVDEDNCVTCYKEKHIVEHIPFKEQYDHLSICPDTSLLFGEFTVSQTRDRVNLEEYISIVSLDSEGVIRINKEEILKLLPILINFVEET